MDYNLEKGKTSRNQVPAWVKGIEVFGLNVQTQVIYDHGCGRFTHRATNALAGVMKKGFKYSGWDAIHGGDGKVTTATTLMVCGSVLNVLKDDEELNEVMMDLIRMTRVVGTALVTIYEGEPKKRTGKVQRNEKTVVYLKKFKAIGDDIAFTKKGNMILMEY